MNAEAIAERPWRLLIGGKMREPLAGKGYQTRNPASGALLAEAPDATIGDVDAAVAAGACGWQAWSDLGVPERARTIRRLAQIVSDHAEELATLDALDCGHPISAMRADLAMAGEYMHMYADWSLRLGGETTPVSPDSLHFTIRQPYGVVARIIPYNHPAMFAATRIAAPLLAGNAVVLKAPPQTPLSALRLGELFADELPAGVLSILTSGDRSVGEALVRHPQVRRIALIGSVATGQAVLAAAAASGIKHVTLELGGKNAMIVFPDCDLDAAAGAAVRGMNFQQSAGQSCGSTSRLLVHESVYADLLERVSLLVKGIRVGDPLDAHTQMGPLVTPEHLARVRGHVAGAVRDGAGVLAGGDAPEGTGFARGNWLLPTVLGDVRPEFAVAREEIFGPVLSALSFRDETEALAIANSVPYGLTGAVWTNDLKRALRVAHRLDAGYVWVNEVSRHYLGVPYGGWKDSGLGREESVDDLQSYTQIKSIHVPFR